MGIEIDCGVELLAQPPEQYTTLQGLAGDSPRSSHPLLRPQPAGDSNPRVTSRFPDLSIHSVQPRKVLQTNQTP